MMLARSNTATYQDVPATLAAVASSSGSAAISSGRYDLFVLVANQDHNPVAVRIKLRHSDSDLDISWIEKTFAALEARLSASPDQDLLNAAEQMAIRLSSSDHSEVSDQWIEATSDLWSRFRD